MRVAPIHSAAAGKLAVIRLLIEHGADVNARQEGDWTALHEVAANGYDELVDALLSAGADPASTSATGQTPADLAGANGHAELAARLRLAARDA
jgi:ankyrin repeat protein